MTKQDYINLRWGTLKVWRITSKRGKKLLKEYDEIGASSSSMQQHDTDRQKEIICELIDLVPGEIYLDWRGKYVSKETAKEYVLNYGKKKRRRY